MENINYISLNSFRGKLKGPKKSVLKMNLDREEIRGDHEH